MITGNAFEYYPSNAELLRDRILEQGDFVSLTEASRFASAAVRIMDAQARLIASLESRLEVLEAK